MKKLILSSAVLFCIIATSCKKDKNKSCDKTMALIAGTYSIVKSEVGLNGNFVDVTSEDFEPCELDDKLTLNANGTTVYKDLGTLCDPQGDDTGTWSITTAGKIIIGGVDNLDTIEADITSFDCSTLVFTGDIDGGSGAQSRFTIKK